MNSMASLIGKVKIKYHGEPVDCDLFDDGIVSMPDGTRKKLPQKQFEQLSSKLTSIAAPEQKGVSGEINAPDIRQIAPFEQYDLKAERRIRRRRIFKIVMGIICALLIAVAVVVMLYFRAPEVLGLIPDSYKVAVANTTIAQGDTIAENEISYIELTRDEYSAQCVNTYMDDRGAMKTDKPIFFINAANQVVNKYADAEIKQGSIITESMVTSQILTGEATVNGEKQTATFTESQQNGKTNIQIIARITDDAGNVQEVPLSSMTLQGRTVEEYLDAAGNELLAEDNAPDAPKQ